MSIVNIFYNFSFVIILLLNYICNQYSYVWKQGLTTEIYKDKIIMIIPVFIALIHFTHWGIVSGMM